MALVRLDRNKPREIEQYFKHRLSKASKGKENLGFGWTMWTPGIGGGYIAISAKFFYYHDSLVSYSLITGMPEEKGLQKRYKKWYKNYFDYSNAGVQPYKFNESAILQPLREYNDDWKDVTDKVINYMTPNSGTMYGYAGGGVIMQNRKAFLEIKDNLTTDQAVLLMYSINPASRLTAIEYYLQHKELFAFQKAIDNWIEVVFKEMPTIKTMFGCFGVTMTTETLFPKYYIDKQLKTGM